MTGTEKIAGKRAFKALTYNGPPESFVAITAIDLSRGGMGSLIGMFEMTMDSIKSFLSFFCITQNGNILVGSFDSLFHQEAYPCLPVG